MDRETKRIVDNLHKGAAKLACGGFLNSLDTLHRSELFIAAGYDRLMRKYNKIHEIFIASNEDWNQTFYTMLFRSMDVSGNRDAYERLSRIVPYSIIQREKHSPKSIEALLLGASGLLAAYREDDYIHTLKDEFSFLAHKYAIAPMRIAEWKLHGIRPYNHPTLRIAQIVAFIAQEDFMFNRAVECCSLKDVEQLVGVDAPTYWSSHFVDEAISDDLPKRIGREKSNLIGINLIAPMQFAYGSYVGSDVIRNRSLSLLESLPAENNRYIRQWGAYGLRAKSAFESQALLQLATEFCARQRCDECPVGRRIMHQTLNR